jgi:hypothetical protein
LRFRALIASPVVILMISGTRLLLVSNYDTETALAILRLGGPTDTVLGTLIPLMPLLLPLAVIFLLVIRQWWVAAVTAACTLLVAQAVHTDVALSQIPHRAWGDFTSYMYGVKQFDWLKGWCSNWSDNCHSYRPLFSWNHGPQVALSGSVIEGRFLVTGLLLLGMLAAMFGVRVNLTSGSAYSSAAGSVIPRFFLTFILMPFVVLVGFSVVSAIYPIPPGDEGIWNVSLHKLWLPPEEVLLTNGSYTVAYVLGEKDKWDLLLVDQGRKIEYVKPEDIKQRSVCALTNPIRRTPFWGSTGMAPADYPLCYAPDTSPISPNNSFHGTVGSFGKPA